MVSFVDIQSLTNSDLSTLVDQVEARLFQGKRIPFKNLGKKWYDQFPSSAGIYAAYRNGELIYIGESANIRKRMAEVHRTYNHPLRKKLGRELFSARVIQNKFEDAIELKLDALFEAEISFSCLKIPIGRLEIEGALIHRNKHVLINDIGVRNNLEI